MGLNSTQMPAGRASFNFDRAALPKWLWEILKEDPFAFIEGMDRAEGGSGEKNSSTEKPKVRAAGV